MSAVLLGLCLLAPAHAADVPVVDDARSPDTLQHLQERNAELEAELHALRQRVEQVERRAARTAPGELVSSGPVVVPVGTVAAEALSLRDDVLVEGHVRGDAVSVFGDVVVAPGGRVDGDVVSIAGSLDVADGATVGGDRVALGLGGGPSLDWSTMADPHHAVGALAMSNHAHEALQGLYQRLVWLLGIAGAGVLTVGLFPHRVGRVATDIEERPLRSAFVGASAATFLTLFAGLFALVTVGLGSPVSLVVLLGLGAAWLLGFVGFCQAVGDRLPFASQLHGRWLAFLVGVVLVAFASSLPWLGWLVLAGASVVGLGASIGTRMGAH
jgi:hypothetical protein